MKESTTSTRKIVTTSGAILGQNSKISTTYCQT